jgi:fumarate reductase flavoprotein subunit
MSWRGSSPTHARDRPRKRSSHEYPRAPVWGYPLMSADSSAADGDVEGIAPVEPPDAWDLEADVVVVGGGGSGLCAAAAALRNGASVVVLEKESNTGGHSAHAGAAAAFDTNVARKARLKFDKQKAFAHAYGVGSNATIDPRLLAMLIDRSHEVYDWAETASWGNRWQAMNIGYIPDEGVARIIVKGVFPQGPFTAGAQLTAGMYPFMHWLDRHVRAHGATIALDTAAQALVRDGDEIVGVRAMQAGTVLHVKANKGVVLAGSGFTNNRAMIKRYCPTVYENAVGTYLPPTDTGEVVRMGLGAGAALAGEDSWTCFAGGIPFFDTSYTGKTEPGPWFQYLRQGFLQLVRGSGWLEINANCEEFLPEVARLDWVQHPKTITGQAGHRAFVIFDANYQTTLWETMPPPLLDDRPMTLDDPEYSWFGKFAGFAPKDYRLSVQQAIEDGGIKVADSVDALARELGLNPDKLVDAVSAWNRKCTRGEMDEFGRLPANMKPILRPPFYGAATGALLGGIFCGPRVNHHLEVVDPAGDPIPGLYAAGTTAGGTNGEKIINATSLSGVGLALATGWIAGDNASGHGTYQPAGMRLRPAVRELRIATWAGQRFPRLTKRLMNAAFVLAARPRRNVVDPMSDDITV